MPSVPRKMLHRRHTPNVSSNQTASSDGNRFLRWQTDRQLRGKCFLRCQTDRQLRGKCSADGQSDHLRKALFEAVEKWVKKFSTRFVKSLRGRRLAFDFPCRKYVKKYLKIISNSKIITIFAVPKLRRSSPNQLILRDLGKFEIILKLYRDVTT